MFVVWGHGQYFRRQQSFVRDTCSHCKRAGTLACYNATHCFTLYYCPVLPLGNKRVFRECPHCKYGSSMPLRKYKKLIAHELEQAIANLEDKPSNREAAIKALATSIHVCHQPGFTRAAAACGRMLTSDKEIAGLIADGHAIFGDHDSAERTLVNALQSNNTPEMRKRLIGHYIETGHVEKAVTQTRQLLDAEGTHAVATAVVVARVLQSAGRHREVVILLDEVQRRFPDSCAADVARLRDKSSQLRDAERPATTVAKVRPPKARRRVLPALVVPAMLLIGVGVYLYLCLLGSPRYTYLVNGLDTPYSVVVNGTSVVLPPKVATPMHAVFGHTHIEPGSKSPPFKPIDVDIEERFLKRPFYDRVHVVNPDALAPIVWEEVAYTAATNTMGMDPSTSAYLNAGKSYYTFDDVDYKFETPPAEIEMSRSSGIERKSHIYVTQSMSPEQVVFGLMNTQGTTELVPYLKRLIASRDVSLMLLTAGHSLIPQEEFGPLLERQTLVRPLRMQAHRYWQQLTEMNEPDRDLAAEYRKLLDADPDNRDLAYLAARVTADPDESLALLKRSISPPNPSAFGHYGMAYRLAAEGKFAEALPHAREAERGIANDATIPITYESLLLATGDYQTLEQHVSNRALGAGIDTDALVDLVRVIATHDPEAARRKMASVKGMAARRWGVPLTDPNVLDIERRCKPAILEGAQKRAQLLKVLDSDPNPQSKLKAALLRQDLEAVKQVIDSAGKDANLDLLATHLLCYLIAERMHRPDIANSSIDAVIRTYEHGDARMRHFAKWLRGDDPPTMKDLTAELSPGSTGAVMLCVFAERFPESRDAYRALARKENFELAFPRMLLDDLLAE